jgi:hypothetical protein
VTRTAEIPGPAPATRQQVVCALAVTLEEEDALFASLLAALGGATFDVATGVLAGPLWPGASFRAWLGPAAPPFPGRGVFLELSEAGQRITLTRCLAPHELLPADPVADPGWGAP